MTYGFFAPQSGADMGNNIVTILDGAGNPMFTKSADRFTLINELTAGAPSFSWSVGRPYRLRYFRTLNYITNTNIAPTVGYYYIASTADTGSSPSPRRRLPLNTSTGSTETDYYIVNANTGAATYIFSESSTGTYSIKDLFFLNNKLWVSYDGPNPVEAVQCLDTTNGFATVPAALFTHSTSYEVMWIAKYGSRVIGVIGGNNPASPATSPRVVEFTNLTVDVLYQTSATAFDSVWGIGVESDIVWFTLGAGVGDYEVGAYNLSDGTFAKTGTTNSVLTVLKNGDAVITSHSGTSPEYYQVKLVEKSGASINTVSNLEYSTVFPSGSNGGYIYRLTLSNQFARYNYNATNSGIHRYAYATTAGTTNTGGNLNTYPGGTPSATIVQKTNTTSSIPWDLRSRRSPLYFGSLPTLGDNDVAIWVNTALVGGLYQEETVTLP